MKNRIINFMSGDSSQPLYKRLIILAYTSKSMVNLIMNVSVIWWIISIKDATGYNSWVSFGYVVLPVISIAYKKIILNDVRWLLEMRQVMFSVVLLILTIIY